MNYKVTIFTREGTPIREYFVAGAASSAAAKAMVEKQTGWKLGIDYERPFDVRQSSNILIVAIRRKYWLRP